MIRNLMIIILIALLAYIFYEEFVADSLEPFLNKYGEKPLFYQVRDPQSAAGAESVIQDPAFSKDPARWEQ